jgi:hypothetical protein
MDETGSDAPILGLELPISANGKLGQSLALPIFPESGSDGASPS